MLIMAVLAAIGVFGAQDVSAHGVYALNPVVVTANRYEKAALEVAASTQTMTAEDLSRTGQNNLQQALSFLDGISYSGMGPNGTAVSSMTSKIIFRGVTDGTLVLVNGTPINWRGKYNLEDIPPGSVEKVEVIRGGGAVLYGSQAIGGVVNIVTKKKMDNQVSIGAGNYGQRDIRVSAGLDCFSATYQYSKMGDTGFISSTWPKADHKSGKIEMQQHFIGAEKHDFLGTYQASDEIQVLYNHNESTNNWEYVFKEGAPEAIKDKPRYDREYTRKKDFLQLNMQDIAGMSGHLYYNKNTLQTKGTDYLSDEGKTKKTKKGRTTEYPVITNKEEKNVSWGYDFQKVWNQDDGVFLLGTSYEKNKYNDGGKADYSRNIYSVFGSWDKEVSPQGELTLSGRETWTTGSVKTFKNFSGELKYLHKVDENTNAYISAGQSFVLPSFSEMYSGANKTGVTLVGDSELKPERGQHYEIGMNKIEGNKQYKLAVFYIDIKDKISYSQGSGNNKDKWFVGNQDFINAGVEASMTVKANDYFSWHTALTIQDPKSKLNSQKAEAKTYWDRLYGKIILNVGATYQKDKWIASLNANCMAQRVLTPSSKHSFAEKPYVLTALNVGYLLSDRDKISFTMSNILGRDDNISHSSSYYRSISYQWMLNYTHLF